MKKLFGNDITPSCEYCELAKFEDNHYVCTKNRKIIYQKCKKFKYDPLKRIPKSLPALKQYSIGDFIL